MVHCDGLICNWNQPLKWERSFKHTVNLNGVLGRTQSPQAVPVKLKALGSAIRDENVSRPKGVLDLFGGHLQEVRFRHCRNGRLLGVGQMYGVAIFILCQSGIKELRHFDHIVLKLWSH